LAGYVANVEKGVAHNLRRYEILTGLVIIGVFWGGLLAGELALRLMTQAKFGLATTAERSSRFYVEADTGLRRIRPNGQMGKIRINNLGFRGPDVTLAKAPDTLRIAFLGASTTFDSEIPRDDGVWTVQTAAALQRAAGESCRVEPVNAGQPAYSLRQVATLYRHHVAPLKPDLVVFMPGDMNHRLDDVAEAQGLPTDPPPPSWLAGRSALMALIEKNYTTIQLQRSALSRAGKVKVVPSDVAAPFEPALRDFARDLRAAGTPLALVTGPSRIRAGQSDEEKVKAAVSAVFYMPYIAIDDMIAVRAAFNDVTRRVAREEGAMLVAAEDAIPADGRHFVDSQHFTEAGAAAQARRVADALLADPRFAQAAAAAGCETRLAGRDSAMTAQVASR
jgi:hypothetical protein